LDRILQPEISLVCVFALWGNAKHCLGYSVFLKDMLRKKV